MATFSRLTCPRCGSASVKRVAESCDCLKCGYAESARKFGKQHASVNRDFPEDTQSVPRPKKGKRRWKEDD